MTTHTQAHIGAGYRCNSVPVIDWVFQHENRVLACAVDAISNYGSYQARLIPMHSAGAGTIEAFDTFADALARHAQLASLLREAGWVLTSYGDDRRTGAAA